MKLKSFLLAILLFSASFSNIRCNLSGECSAALADLFTDIILQGSITIIAGTPFPVTSSVTNLTNTVQQCKGDIRETLTAGASQSRLQIDFDPTGSGNFSQNELNNNFAVPEIPPSDTCLCDYEFIFTEPGDYRLITFADDMEDVEERDETNNESNPKIANPRGTTEYAKAPLIIRVLPNPNFTRKPGQPKVEVVSYRVRFQ